MNGSAEVEESGGCSSEEAALHSGGWRVGRHGCRCDGSGSRQLHRSYVGDGWASEPLTRRPHASQNTPTPGWPKIGPNLGLVCMAADTEGCPLTPSHCPPLARLSASQNTPTPTPLPKPRDGRRSSRPSSETRPSSRRQSSGMRGSG
jgi:hypothetical protein